MASATQFLLSGRWPTVFAIVCFCLIDSAQSVGVVARLRDKMATVADDLSMDKPIAWNRWAWMGEGHRLAKSMTAAKRDALLQDLEAAEAEEKAKENEKAKEEETVQPDSGKDRVAPEDEAAVDDSAKETEVKSKRDPAPAQNGKRGRLNRPVIHAG